MPINTANHSTQVGEAASDDGAGAPIITRQTLRVVAMHRDPALHQLIADIARERGLRVEYDTHYDAFNWEIRWWADGVVHAVDIQLYPEGWVEVSRLRTHFPMLPRLLAWALRVVPMLPRWGRTTREPLARLAWLSESARLRELIAIELPRNG